MSTVSYIPAEATWKTRTLCDGVIDWKTDGVILTASQKGFYEKNGYILVKNAISKGEIQRYTERFQTITEAPKGKFPGITVMRDISFAKQNAKERNINKIQDFQDDPVLFDYCKHPMIVGVMKDIIGTPSSNLMAMHTMVINKCPDNGGLRRHKCERDGAKVQSHLGSMTSRHPMHQDSQFFPFRPADFIACAWTAMQTINRTNGCLSVVPGTHKGPVHEHEYPTWEGGVNKAYMGIRDFDASVPLTYVEMEAGDTLFFHPTLIHGSGANRTAGFRKSISCHYANADYCKYVAPAETTPDHIATEIVEMMKDRIVKLGFDQTSRQMDLTDVWRYRARPVNGTRANL